MPRLAVASLGAIALLSATFLTAPSAGAAPAGQGNNTQTTLVSSQNPSLVGASVTFTATVTTLQGAPVTDGIIEISNGFTGSVFGSGTPDSNGQFSITFTPPRPAIQLAAIFSRSLQFGESAALLVQNVDGYPTELALSSSPNPSLLGESVTFTAAVTASGAPLTSGSVIFVDDTTSTVLGTVAVDGGGQAALTTDALVVGGHAIRAFHLGTDQLEASQSTLTQQVDEPPATTTTTTTTTAPSTTASPTTVPPTTLPSVDQTETVTALSWSPNAPVLGEPVTFTATITPAAVPESFGFRAPRGAPGSAGAVTFTDGGTTLAVVPLDASGQASYTTSGLSVGTHVIAATYGGSVEFAPSTTSVTLAVEGAPTPPTTVPPAQLPATA